MAHQLLEDIEEQGLKKFSYLGFLALVQQLKQICNHPCQLMKSVEYRHYTSGKWELFTEILSECLEADMEVVVFSQYTAMLDIIEAYLKENGIVHAGLRGAMPLVKRLSNADIASILQWTP